MLAMNNFAHDTSMLMRTDGLSCVTKTIFDMSLSKFDIKSFEKQLKNLKIHENGTINVCHVTLDLGYGNQMLQA